MIKVAFFFISLLIQYLYTKGIVTPLQSFWGYSLLNIIITSSIIYIFYRRDNKIGLLHPTILTSIDFFAIGFGFTNFIAHDGLPDSLIQEFPGSDPILFANPIMLWSIWAHLCLWLGSEIINDKIERWTKIISEKTIFQKRGISINLIRLLYVFTIASNFTLIYLGYYGVNIEEDAVEEINSWVGLLKILSNFGLLSFFFNVLYYFQNKKGQRWVIGILLCEFFFGLAAGYKNQIFVPFLILSFAYFYTFRKINYKYIIPAVLAIQIAYGLVQPYREILLRTKNENIGIKEMYEMYILAQEFKDDILSVSMDTNPIYFQISNRLNLLGPTTIAYQHFKNYGIVKEYRIPDRIFYLPLMVLAPKSIWTDKPINNIGHITTQKVYGHYSDNITSITITSIGYGFLGWGTMWVIIPIFLVFGLIQNFYSKILYHWNLVGLIIYLAAMPQLVKVEELSLFLIAIIRSLIIGFVIQKVVLTNTKLKPNHN